MTRLLRATFKKHTQRTSMTKFVFATLIEYHREVKTASNDWKHGSKNVKHLYRIQQTIKLNNMQVTVGWYAKLMKYWRVVQWIKNEYVNTTKLYLHLVILHIPFCVQTFCFNCFRCLRLCSNYEHNGLGPRSKLTRKCARTTLISHSHCHDKITSTRTNANVILSPLTRMIM